MVESIYEKIRIAAAKAVDAGAHLNAATAAENIGKSLGLSDALVQFAHVELRNVAFEPDFKKVPFAERAIFLPHCSRNIKVCKATSDDEGFHCKECGACDIDKVMKLAKKLGYKQVFMVPGGSMVKKVLEKYKPKAAIGIACFHEAVMAFELTKQINVIPQAVLLLRDGCKDTQINLALVEEKMLLIDENVLTKEGKLKPLPKKITE
ncbi:MAG: DUF116 domain-containing protein [archaeon]|jgi:hypothetical protein